MRYSPQEEAIHKREQLWVGWEAAQLGPRVPLHWHAASISHGYRNRLRLRVTPTGEIAFFNLGKVAECLVVDSQVLLGMRTLQALGQPPCPGWEVVSHLEIRSRDHGGKLGLYLSGENTLRLIDVQHDLQRQLGDTWTVGGQGTDMTPCQTFLLPGRVQALVPLNGFMQVNSEMNALLIKYVVEIARSTHARSFFDLFMGAGNFALPLLASGLVGRAVESHIGAVSAASSAARAQGLAFAELDTGLAEQSIRRWVGEGQSADLVVSDPPRAGLKHLAEGVAALANDNLVLCSCAPRNLWKDLVQLLPLGFEVRELAAFEMFPRTDHLEVVAWLVRK